MTTASSDATPTLTAAGLAAHAAEAARCSCAWHYSRAIRGLPDRSELGSLRKPARRRAYVTLLTNAAYAPGVRALYNSLSEHESEYPLVVMATPAVPASVIADLRSRGCEVRPVPLLPVPTGNGGAARYAAPHFAECWSKLRVWELDEEFELIALVDADMVVVRSIDALLEEGALASSAAAAAAADEEDVAGACRIAAVHECFCVVARGETPCAYLGGGSAPPAPHAGSYFNSGLVVLRPSRCVYAHMMRALAATDVGTLLFPDQDFLNRFFGGRWSALPWVYNATKGLYACHRHDVWDLATVRNIHFTMAKPWDLTNPLHRGFERLNQFWQAAFSEPRTLCRLLLKATLQERRERSQAQAQGKEKEEASL